MMGADKLDTKYSLILNVRSPSVFFDIMFAAENGLNSFSASRGVLQGNLLSNGADIIKLQ